MLKKAGRSGAAQRRQRRHMRKRGWSSITTYITDEHKRCLNLIKEAHGLSSLHEALHLLLSQKSFEQASRSDEQIKAPGSQGSTRQLQQPQSVRPSARGERTVS